MERFAVQLANRQLRPADGQNHPRQLGIDFKLTPPGRGIHLQCSGQGNGTQQESSNLMPMNRTDTLPDMNTDVLAWRRRVLSIVLWVIVGVRTLQFLRFLATLEHTPAQVTVVAVLYVVLLLLAVFRNLPHLLRGWCVYGLGYGAVITLFLLARDIRPGVILGLTSIPINAAILCGRRSAWVATGLSATLLTTLALVKHSGLPNVLGPLRPVANASPDPYSTLVVWLVILLPMMLLLDRFTALFQRLLANERDMRLHLEAEINERHYLEGALLETSERERQTVCHELHDGVCQQITGAMLQAKVLERTVAAGRTIAAQHLQAISVMLDGSLGQMHDLARGLSPGTLSAEALVPSLRDLARRTRETFEVACEVEAQEPLAELPPATATHLYRIAQEAVINAVKHGHPRQILVRLQSKGGQLLLEIDNDGQPLAQAAGDQEGMGLRIMRYRSELIGGTFALGLDPEQGVRVRCSVPLVSA